MKYYITIPDDELFVEGVVVYYTLNKKGTRTIRVQHLGDVSIWNRIGLLEAGAIKEKNTLRKLFDKTN